MVDLINSKDWPETKDSQGYYVKFNLIIFLILMMTVSINAQKKSPYEALVEYDCPFTVVKENPLQTPIEITGWIPPIVYGSNDCETCENQCSCPPFVCEAGYCKKSYVVVFTSKKCRYCKRMWPVIEELRKDGHQVVHIDTGKHPGVFNQFNLRAWPTTVVFDEGHEKVRFVGVTSSKEIRKKL